MNNYRTGLSKPKMLLKPCYRKL